MKFSSKVQKCGLSPMRKFPPYAVAAEAKGRNIYHLNIGQPDIETPKAFFDAVRSFDQPVLEYAPSPGVPALIEAIRDYYAALDMHFAAEDILITNGGSEALQIAMNCILDDGDEILIDVDEGVLELHVSDEEIAERYKTLELPKKNIPNGYLRLYAKVAASADEGAIIKA